MDFVWRNILTVIEGDCDFVEMLCVVVCVCVCVCVCVFVCNNCAGETLWLMSNDLCAE